MERSEFERAYNEQAELRSDLGIRVEGLLSELCEEERVATLSIGHRVKSRESALRKLNVKGLTSFEQITDLVGLRIITYFRDDVDKVAQVVEREFEIDRDNSVDKRAVLDPDRFGYLSVHYIATLSATRTTLTEYRRFAGVQFELQIRSVLQHAWAEIEHDIGYKSEAAVPRSERRAFSRLAGLLEMADDEFVGIRDRLKDYQLEIQADVARGDHGVEIDQESVLALLRSGNAILSRTDLAIAQIGAGVRASNGMPDRDYAGARATQLRRCGLKVLGDIWRVLVDGETEFLEFVRRWLKNDYPASSAIPSFPKDVRLLQPNVFYKPTSERLAELSWPRGVSLFYVARYLGAATVLESYLRRGQWNEEYGLEDRLAAACLAATRGSSPVEV